VGNIEQMLEQPQWHSLLSKALETSIISTLQAKIDCREQVLDQCQKKIEHLVARINLCANDDCPNLPGSYKHGLRKCARCWVVAYCSKSCQITDWSVHKLVCKK